MKHKSLPHINNDRWNEKGEKINKFLGQKRYTEKKLYI